MYTEDPAAQQCGGRSGRYPLLDGNERIPVLLYVYYNIWKHKMVLCAGSCVWYYNSIFSDFAGAESGGEILVNSKKKLEKSEEKS